MRHIFSVKEKVMHRDLGTKGVVKELINDDEYEIKWLNNSDLPSLTKQKILIKDRNLADVLGKMIVCIPASHSTLIGRLENLQEDLLYVAPEAVGIEWERANGILKAHLIKDIQVKGDLEEWKIKVIDIWQGTEYE